ncbi:hypothetical protein CANARDRAFT_212939 [[Candida] arabinofermentans NRRL YB-2248]|uniref:Uncharacterized protein n=1 Tax=[Candida] arabinofermentans NRRL YB-2248 TaxID=983967 RepID=A0A1E4SZI7_9ASCO|nr:hypothetical protein CANARDRAFT_212939 [[Candida] arabinofermentans NRRL YB-2248]
MLTDLLVFQLDAAAVDEIRSTFELPCLTPEEWQDLIDIAEVRRWIKARHKENSFAEKSSKQRTQRFVLTDWRREFSSEQMGKIFAVQERILIEENMELDAITKDYALLMQKCIDKYDKRLDELGTTVQTGLNQVKYDISIIE